MSICHKTVDFTTIPFLTILCGSNFFLNARVVKNVWGWFFLTEFFYGIIYFILFIYFMVTPPPIKVVSNN